VAVDVSLAWLPFEEEAIAAAVTCDFAGVRIRVPRPEDLVVYKMVAARPRDLDDVENLLLVHGSTMDLRRVRAVVADLPPLSRTWRDPRSSSGSCARPASGSPFAGAGGYRRRYSPLRPPVLRTRRISPIVMDRSAALTMS
jgi:Nucleotidyltransferase of unknown function (DUF6036)